MWQSGVLALVLMAGTAQAEGLQSSPRPMLRPTALAVSTAAAVADVGPAAAPSARVLRPKLRPADLVVATPATEAPAVEVTEATEIIDVAFAPAAVLRPKLRPTDMAADPAAAPAPRKRLGLAGLFLASAVRTPPNKAVVMPKKGSVCGDPAIRGEVIAPIVGRIKGCGVEEAVRITAIDGVALSEAATIDCNTAQALRAWVRDGLQPAFGDNPVVELQVAGHYVCRPRNNIRGNKISEHGRGKAIDISGFRLANGSVVTVARNWRHDYGKAIKAAYRAGCGTFGTTLGPGSDGHHEDHLHFDTARHNNGAYCR